MTRSCFFLLFSVAFGAHAQNLWHETGGEHLVDLPSLAPLVTKSSNALLVVKTPKAALPPGHPPIPDDMRRGEASGFIIHTRGYALTNQHTVGCGTVVKVKVYGQTEWLEARVLGIDKETDVALLELPKRAGGWPSLPLGSSAALHLGDFVVAMGNPQGLRFSVSMGIISGRGRKTGSEAEYGYLQTDAAINPGNSGGPLLDLAGAVIGINTAIDAKARGIAYAIPIDVVKRILPDLEKHGRLRRGWLGISMAETPDGLKVLAVTEESPASRAGLVPGDLITGMASGSGTLVMTEFRREARLLGPDAAMTLQVHREGAILPIVVILGELPATFRSEVGEACQDLPSVPTSQPQH